MAVLERAAVERRAAQARAALLRFEFADPLPRRSSAAAAVRRRFAAF